MPKFSSLRIPSLACTCLWVLAISTVVFAQDDAVSESVLDDKAVAEESGDVPPSPPIQDQAVPAVGQAPFQHQLGPVRPDQFVQPSEWNNRQIQQPIDWNAAAPRPGYGWQDYQRGPVRNGKMRKHNVHNNSQVQHVGFAVEEVQYGANAGSPNFGVVSHGPWYNGSTFGFFGNHEQRQCKTSVFSKIKRRVKRFDQRSDVGDSGNGGGRVSGFESPGFLGAEQFAPSPSSIIPHQQSYPLFDDQELGPAPSKIPTVVNPESQPRDGQENANVIEQAVPTEIKD